jgi:hypothetical protein
MFRRSFFLLRLVDVKGVRVTECSGRGYEYTVGVRTDGYGALESGDIGKGEQMREGALRGVLQVKLEGVAGQVNRGDDHMKGIFSRI